MKRTKDELFEELLAEHGVANRASRSISRIAGAREGEASFGQRRIWISQMLEQASSAYNILLALKIRGRLSPAALEQALQTIVNRHEALRTCFKVVNGKPHQVASAAVPVRLAHVDLSEVRDNPDVVAKLLATKQRTHFSLDRTPLFDFTLVRLGLDMHALLIGLHHIVFDFVSSLSVFDELNQLYTSYARGAACPLQEPRVQYLDYSNWQIGEIERSSTDATLEYWKRTLGTGDGVAFMDLPSDRVVPGNAREPAFERFVIPSALPARVRELSSAARLSTFSIWLAAFQVLLHRYAGSDDILLCVPHSERNHPDLERTIGFFLNPIVVRLRVRGRDSFTALLRSVNHNYLEAIAHSYPFEKLVESLSPQRHRGVTRLGDVGFSHERISRSKWQLGDLNVAFMDVNVPIAKVELSLSVYEDTSRCVGYLEYNAARFSSRLIKGMAAHYVDLLERLLEQPDRPIATVLDRRADSPRANLVPPADVGKPARPATHVASEIIEEQARRRPHAIAVAHAGEHVSYDALNRRANRIARRLRRAGVRPQAAVGLLLSSGIDAYASILGVLKAAAVYVPMNPAYPAPHLRQMIDTAEVQHVIVAGDAEEKRAALREARVAILDVDALGVAGVAEDDRDLGLAPSDEMTAYVCFTSGSTGRSKGVFVSHRALSAHLAAFGSAVPITPDDRVLQFAALTFDVSLEQMLSAWQAGATLVPRGDQVWGAREFVDVVQQDALTVTNLPTAYWNQLVRICAASADVSLPSTLRLMIVGGEAMLIETARLWHRVSGAHVRLVNAYGPTEAVITASVADVNAERDLVDDRASVPMGMPLAGRSACLIGQHGSPVPTAVAGELCLGGLALADGYLKSARLTATHFRPASHVDTTEIAGARMYATGDWVRRLADGSLEFVQRRDDEVKIRGVRVSPGVIESVLLAHPSIIEAAAVVREAEPASTSVAGSTRTLVLFYSSAESVSGSEIREYLERRLPDYMIPAESVRLDALPKTTHGKIDRVALQELRLQPKQESLRSSSPVSATEEALAAIWCRVLGVPQVRVHDNFFELGGHSLLATQVIMEIELAFSLRVPLASIFTYPTISQLGEHLATRQQHARKAVDRPAEVADLDHVPLSAAQRRLWYASQLSAEGLEYKIVKTLEMRGRLNVAALRQALSAVVRRHESLRTTFGYVAGKLGQKISSAEMSFVEYVDLSELAATSAETAYASVEHDVRKRSFDLERGPLLRVSLVRFSQDCVRLLFDAHHIIIDGWSFGILVRELNALYDAATRGMPDALPPAPQYQRYVMWETSQHSYTVLDRQLSYWRQKLHELPSLDLARAQRGESPQASDGEIGFALNATVSRQVLEACGRLQSTPFIFLTSVFHALLYANTGATDIAIGTDIANRDSREHADLIGFVANQLVLRVNAAPHLAFRRLCDDMQRTVEEAVANKDVPYETLVRELKTSAADPTRKGLFRVKCVFHTQMPEVTIRGVSIRSLPLAAATAKFDLLLNLEIVGDEVHGTIEYSGVVFDEPTIVRMVEQFKTLCRRVAQDVDLPIEVLARDLASEEQERSRQALARAKAARRERLAQVIASPSA